mmetsp:Transcript_20408/g.30183  ORF Transcript_20408/g.30183 Transcript_20408/m.30183 type:complete len:148 (+) Transcript_20408:49-492(+)
MIVNLSYVVAISYVIADAVSKGYTCNRDSSENCSQNEAKNFCAVPATLDVLMFQMLASIVFPGFTINRWVTFVSFMEEKIGLQNALPLVVYEYLPTAAGLALIPLVVKPLDSLVEKVLDLSVRPILVKNFPFCQLEPIFGGERDARE